MSVITTIEESIKARLAAEISGVPGLSKTMRKPDGTTVVVAVKIESYPRQPSEQALLAYAASGAVVVRYTGSTYSSERDVPGYGKVQDRAMVYEVLVFSESLTARESGTGIYDLLDTAAVRLIGFQPAGSVSSIELVQDDFVEERKGAWSYGLLIRVNSQITGV